MIERSLTLTASGSSPLDKTDSKLTLPRNEVQESDHRSHECPDSRRYPHIKRWESVVLQQLGVAADHGIHGVELNEGEDRSVESADDVFGCPQDRRQIHPNPHEERQKARRVAEEDLECGKEGR